MLRWITTYGRTEHDVGLKFFCSFYRGDPVNTNLATLIVGNVRVPGTRLICDTATYCHPRENLFLVTSDVVPVGQAVGANIGVEEWDEHEISRGDGS
jgi:hypothetical protein